MNKILTIAKYDIVKMFRDRTALLFVFLLPVIFTFLVGLVFGNVTDSEGVFLIPVGITSYDESMVSQKVIDELSKKEVIRVIQMDEEALRERVRDSSLQLGFIIPENFGSDLQTGRTTAVKVVKLPSSADYAMIEGLMHSAYTRVMAEERIAGIVEQQLGEDESKQHKLEFLKEKVAGNLDKPGGVEVRKTEIKKQAKSFDYDMQTQVSLGYMIMFVMFTLILGAGEILEERKIHTWDRLAIAPVTRPQIMLGKITGTFARGWVQVSFLILFGSMVMGVNFGDSILSTVLVMSIFLLSVTGMGLFMASLVKTNAQLGPVATIFIMVSSMMSGLWWPIELEPLFMQKIAVVFPQYWAMKALKRLIVADMDLAAVTDSLAALVGIGLFFFLLVSLRRKKSGLA